MILKKIILEDNINKVKIEGLEKKEVLDKTEFVDNSTMTMNDQ